MIKNSEDFGLVIWSNHMPQLTDGLIKLELVNNYIRDDIMGVILGWALTFSSNTLESLIISRNALKQVPSKVSRFSKLSYLDMNQQSALITIPAGSLSFQSPISALYLRHCYISTIEPGAFQGRKITKLSSIVIRDWKIFLSGDFSHAEVDLSFNYVTKLEFSVFKQLLEQMAQGSGRLRISDRKFPALSVPQYLCILFHCIKCFL